MTRFTFSTDLPIASAVQPSFGGGSFDGFVAKFDATGVLVYSTYLGGSGRDWPLGVGVDEQGNACIAGYRDEESIDSPTVNALQPVFGGDLTDAFVTKLNSTGSAFLYSTFLGGTGRDFGMGIAVDKNGSVYVTGSSGGCDCDD